MALALEEESSGVWLNFGAVALHKAAEARRLKFLYFYVFYLQYVFISQRSENLTMLEPLIFLPSAYFIASSAEKGK
jgi:hypothetical protein